MDHSTHARLNPDEMTPSILIGAAIYDAEDEKVGSISHLHQTGTEPEAVVDVGGFLGIGSKPVLVRLHDLTMMRDAHGTVHGTTFWTKEQLKALPEHRA
jgi:hypothetical protein